jgi:hypothetical protein
MLELWRNITVVIFIVLAVLIIANRIINGGDKSRD